MCVINGVLELGVFLVNSLSISEVASYALLMRRRKYLM